jgi:hypothetical protein
MAIDYPLRFQQRPNFLSNEKEFFAVTGTIYLFGKIQQVPFTCETMSKSDPAYMAFLESTFGHHECNRDHRQEGLVEKE